jgi:hypothetical protein
MNYKQYEQFSKEFGKLIKKYPSLDNDMIEFSNIISSYPLGSGRHFHVIHRSDTLCVVKARFFCRYLKGACMRIIYAYNALAKDFEFIEIYFKGDKENEDRERIKQYIKDHQTP